MFEADLTLLPETHLTRLTGFVRRYNEIIHQIQSFRGIPSENKQEIIGKITKSTNELYEESLQHFVDAITLSAVQLQVALREEEQSLEVKRRELDSAIVEFSEVMKKTKEDAETTLKDVRESARAVGVVEHAVIFNGQAEEHRKAAWWWLAAVILLAGATIYATIRIYLHSAVIVATLTTS
jgi:hypothetical protein